MSGISRPRTERPEFIALGMDPKAMVAAAEVRNILFLEDMPLEEERQPDTLYLPNYPVSERDEALGCYLAAWNKIERQIVAILSQAVGQESPTGRIVFELGLNVNALTDFILRHLIGTGNNDVYEDVRRWLEQYKRANTRRNRIVHADWVCELKCGARADGKPFVASQRWLRKYNPSDVPSQVALKNNDPKARGKFIHTVEQIERATEHCIGLAEAAMSLLGKLRN